MNLVLWSTLASCLLCFTHSAQAGKNGNNSYFGSGRTGRTGQNVLRHNSIHLEGKNSMVRLKSNTRTFKGDDVQSNPGGNNQEILQTSRVESIFFNLEMFGNWSKWSHCERPDCTQHRHRECMDDSWLHPRLNSSKILNCASKYYAEIRVCLDKSACATPAMLNNCGVRPEFVGPAFKILGGEISKPNSWPWAVRLSTQLKLQDEITLCGATLVDSRWIVTAAHCLTKLIESNPFDVQSNTLLFSNQLLYAHLGDHRRSKVEVTQRTHLVEKAILHPAYHPGRETIGADIALLYLAEPADLSPEVNFACLPNEFIVPEPGTECYAVGWGIFQSKADSSLWDKLWSLLPYSDKSKPRHTLRRPRAEKRTSDELREVNLPILSNSECGNYYTNLNEQFHICAGSDGKDTCPGDSGGGLYCPLPNSNKWLFAGVTSFGGNDGCGIRPGVYTSVIAHQEWIRRTIAKEQSNPAEKRGPLKAHSTK